MLFAFMDALSAIKINHAKYKREYKRDAVSADDALRREELNRKKLANVLIAQGFDRSEAYKKVGLI